MWRTVRPDAATVLTDKKVRTSLARYFQVMENDKPAKFQIAQRLPANFDQADPLPKLWKIHQHVTEEFNRLETDIDAGQKSFDKLPIITKSYLALKITIANHVLGNCHFCTRSCGVNRLANQLGFCKCGTEITVSTMFAHLGEEPELVPSGTIFTQGCTLKCRHCQNWTISQWHEEGHVFSTQQLANSIEALRRNGCRNVNLVGGEPTPWLPQWLSTFKLVKSNVPVVWNSNAYYSYATAQLLAGFVDVYLLDFKYGPFHCAEKLSAAPQYWEACTQNHHVANSYGDLIIRHLVLPNHIECCTHPVLKWIAKNLGKDVRTNVMFQYRPEWEADQIPELRRRLTEQERRQVIELTRKTGLTNYLI